MQDGAQIVWNKNISRGKNQWTTSWMTKTWVLNKSETTRESHLLTLKRSKFSKRILAALLIWSMTVRKEVIARTKTKRTHKSILKMTLSIFWRRSPSMRRKIIFIKGSSYLSKKRQIWRLRVEAIQRWYPIWRPEGAVTCFYTIINSSKANKFSLYPQAISRIHSTWSRASTFKTSTI